MSENPRQASLESQKTLFFRLTNLIWILKNPKSTLEGCKLIIIQTFFVKVMEGLIIIQKMIAGQKSLLRVLL